MSTITNNPPAYQETEDKTETAVVSNGVRLSGEKNLKNGISNVGFISHEDDVKVVVGDDIPKKSLPEEEEEEDPWKLSEVTVEVTPWRELTTCGKFKRVFWDYLGKFILLLGFLYLFICSLDFLGNAFKLIGGKTAGSVFSESKLLSNPVAGLMIGVLGTVLLQSSSTTTTIVVSMVAAKIIDVKLAIPIVMGANIGTSVTNTIVSIGQIANKNDFRRAFAGATVHDMFNWLSVVIFLILEVCTGYLYHLTDLIVNSLSLSQNEAGEQEFLKVITKPLTHLIIQVDKKVIQDVAHGIPEAMNKSMIKHCCKKEKIEVQRWNMTDEGNNSYTAIEDHCLETCDYLFEHVATTWSDTTVGIVLLVLAVVVLCTCLICIVKTLNSLLKGKIAVVIKKFVNYQFPGKFAYFTGYIAILIGTGMTILVQSSSVFTSALTPLVGIGVITIDRMYPLTLGANIGTTTTAILAALAQEPEDIKISLQISLCHLFFNLSGIVLFYPIPFLRFPIRMAKFLGNETAKYRWFAIFYLILSFFILPALVFGLSYISWQVMVGVLAPIAFIVIFIAVIKVFQRKWPRLLPPIVRNWKFLPLGCRSLEPYDRVVRKIQSLFACCTCCNSEEKSEKQSRERTVSVEGNTVL